MIVDIDVGNSYAKWRIVSSSGEKISGAQTVESILKQQRLNFDCQEQICQVRLSY